MKVAFPVLLGLLLLVPVAGAEDVAKETVTFGTADGLTITGDLWPSGQKGAPGVVALHMYRSDRTAWEPVAERFAKAGVDFLAIDMRGHGDSAVQDGEDLGKRVAARDPELFNSMWQDAAAAVAFLADRGTDADRIALAGASVGCSVAIDAVRRDPALRGAAVLTPGANYLGVPTMEHVREYGARRLLILTSKEEAGNGSRRIAAALGERRAELVELPQTGIHGTRMFGKVEGVEDRLVGWLSDLVGGGLSLDGEPDSAEAEVVRSGRWISARGPAEGFFLGIVPAEPSTTVIGFASLGYRASKEGVTEMRLRDGEWEPARIRRMAGMSRPRVELGSVLEILVHMPPGAEKVRIVRSEEEDPAKGALLEPR